MIFKALHRKLKLEPRKP